MEEETPHWENKVNNNISSLYLSKCLGKCCDISFKKGVYIPQLSKVAFLFRMKATIIGFDSFYLIVEFFQSKKKCTSLLALSNINGITFEEN